MSELITLEHVNYRPGETVAVGVGRSEDLHLVTFGMDWRPARDIMLAMSDGEPIVVEVEEWQIMSRTANPVIRPGDVCPACEGEGRDAADRVCGNCEGTGEVLPSKSDTGSAAGIDTKAPF